MRAGIAGLLVIAGATGRGSAATRAITFDTREVTEAAGASFIKVYPSLPWPLQLAVVDEARSVGTNPLDDIKNTQAIWRTVKGGWIFEPPATRLTSSGEP